MKFTTFTIDPPTEPSGDPEPWPDAAPRPWTLSRMKRATAFDLEATTRLAQSLANATGEAVSILFGSAGYWLALPADRADFWATDLASGRARIIETVVRQLSAPAS